MLPPDPTLEELEDFLPIAVEAAARLLACRDAPYESWPPDVIISWVQAYKLALLSQLHARNGIGLLEAAVLVHRLKPLLYDLAGAVERGEKIQVRLAVNHKCAVWIDLGAEVYDYRSCRLIPLGGNNVGKLDLGVMTSIDLQQHFDSFVEQVVERRGQ